LLRAHRVAPSFTSNCPGRDPQSTPTIVLIDHDDAFRHALAEHLRDDGFGVVEYAGASDLESTPSLERADALVHDVTESEDGLRFAARVHAQHPTLPIVVLTAYPTPQLEARIAAIQYVALLRKPLSYTDLYEWLQQRLVRRSPATQIR
jgi:FixJ family two-component response regulator